ncbi:hypothetical protein ACOSP7_006873 [Xanthoceras sorbifolium]
MWEEIVPMLGVWSFLGEGGISVGVCVGFFGYCLRRVDLGSCSLFEVLINHNVARVENELEGQGLTVDGEQSCIVADMEGSHFSGEESAVGQNGNSISGKDSVISRFSPKKTCGRKWKRAARNVPNQSALEGIPSPI